MRKTGIRQMVLGGGLAGLGGALGVASQETVNQAALHPLMTGLMAVGIVYFFLGLFQTAYRDKDNADA